MPTETKVTGNHEGATNQAAYDEAMRELGMRERMFPRWVQEGKISRTDARTRLDAQARLCFLASQCDDVITVQPEVEGNNPPF